MNTASRFVLGLLLAAAGFLLDASDVKAQEVQVTGPLAGQPAVRHMRIYRDGRFQIQPSFGVTIADDFARAMLAGVQLGYHFTDWIGLSAFFDYNLVQGGGIGNTGLTDQITDHGQTTNLNRLSLPSAAGFSDQVGRINYLAGVQATFIPLRGKLSLFQALFVDTDFYLFGGVAFAGVEERQNILKNAMGDTACDNAQFESASSTPGAAAQCVQTQSARASRMAIAPTFGVGLSMYFTDYLALTLEYRAFPFKWNTSGTDEGGQNKNRQADNSGQFPDGQINEADRIFHFNQMFKLGLAFYLPFQGRITE
ncbi:MAG: outer membrane beta-barrel domain-containing protein [Myxococcales bacterium]